MAHVVLPRSLLELFPAAVRRLDIDAATVAGVIDGLDGRWPGMRDRLSEPGPRIREHINVFVDGERATIDTALGPESVVHVIPAVSGG
jgi:sulfur-carrier protein